MDVTGITYSVNEDGFTFWKDNLFILLDVPFIRLKENPELQLQTLEIIHVIEMNRKR
jgi:hypothetical protein